MDAPTKPRIRVKAAGFNSFAMSDSLAAGLTPQPNPHHGASVTRRMAAWRPTSSGPNAVVNASSDELVRRSRDARRNNPMARRSMSLLSTHTVGGGIKPRPLCKNAKVRAALTELWADWTAVADADGVLDFYGLQALAVSEMVEAGESFCRLRTRKLSDGLPVPLQLQLIPSEQLPLSYAVPDRLNPIVQSIERNPIGKRTAYWVLPQHPGEFLTGFPAFSPTPVRVSAEDVAHMYNVSRIGQLRGLPWLSAAITTLYQVNQYLDAELLRKQMVALIVGFIRKPAAEMVLPQNVQETLGPISEAADGGPPDVAMEPGTMTYLEAGEDVVFNSPGDVGGNFDTFLTATYRTVAAGADLIYEELTGDWSNTNDRTFRAMFGTFKRTVRQWQFNLVAAQFCTPVWTRFVDYALASGALVVPKSVNEQDLRRCEWRPERWEYLNPVQDVAATGEAIALGLTSRQAEVAERGDDIEVVDAQLADDHAREEALGLSFGTKAAAPAAIAAPDAATAADPAQEPPPAKKGKKP